MDDLNKDVPHEVVTTPVQQDLIKTSEEIFSSEEVSPEDDDPTSEEPVEGDDDDDVEFEDMYGDEVHPPSSEDTLSPKRMDEAERSSGLNDSQ